MTQSKVKNFIRIENFKSVLCLDGTLPDISFFKLVDQLPIIAADGAANKLKGIDVNPSLIIGDLDSVDQNLTSVYPTLKVTDQNYSDYQKCMSYINREELGPTIVCGIAGGHIDHVINNIGIFMEGSGNVFIDDNIVGLKLTNRHKFNFPFETKISIFGIPSCTITTKGLKWELEHQELNFPSTSSCFNRTVSPTIDIQVTSGAALMIVYQNAITDGGVF